MNTTVQNIYATSTLAPHDAQILLTLALFCLILGVLLVEKKVLLAFGSAFFASSKSRSAVGSSSL
jgi:hypothetical protein